MAEVVVLPAMGGPQEEAWRALLDLYRQLPGGWCLVGGQLVHLHCAERGVSPSRPTNDLDAVLDVRADQQMLLRFTQVLHDLGFRPEISGEGLQHRYVRGEAQIDVLIAEGTGERASLRPGAGGAPSLAAPGATQALQRAEAVTVRIGEQVGTVLRPSLVGALVGKAAARVEIASDRASSRHCIDFVVLASLVSARDFRDAQLSSKDRQRLHRMLVRSRADGAALAMPGAAEALDRVERAGGLSS